MREDQASLNCQRPSSSAPFTVTLPAFIGIVAL